MILNLIIAAIAFLFARAAWDFTKYRAKEMNMQPITWLLKMTFLLSALGLIGYIAVLTVAYILVRS